ncbi:MAG: addiction module protein [Saprospiraceae bacterium]
MKITINIKDNKVGFFLELLQSFDFITIEKADSESTELSEEHKKILNERLANYKSDPENLLDWDDVRKDLNEGLS